MNKCEEIKKLDLVSMVEFIATLKRKSKNCSCYYGCLKCHWSKQCRIYSIDFMKRWLYGKAYVSEYIKYVNKAEPSKTFCVIDRIRNLDFSGMLHFVSSMKKISYKCEAVNTCENCEWLGLCQASTYEQIENWLKKSVSAAAAEMKEMRKK